MGKNLTKDEFIMRCEKLHHKKYYYSLVDYTNKRTKVKIICSKHGEFQQTPDSHMRGSGCYLCGLNKISEKKRLTQKDFIYKAKNIHDDYYIYDDVKYSTSKTKIKIICPKHGEFQQTPFDHLSGCGCQKCGKIKIGLVRKLDEGEFIEKSIHIHKNKYDYSLIKYRQNDIDVKIICKKHGKFTQTPHIHLRGSGCPICGGNVKLNKNGFIIKAKKIHEDMYDYSLVKYRNNKTKVSIICKKHGKFTQTPNSHVSQKQGCPNCKESKGENIINKYLKERKIKFKRQKKFDDCKNKRELPFDFYLPKENILIEYDGEQHYKPIDFFGGEESFKQTKINDGIKTNYAKNNNIKLIRIGHKNLNQINNILKLNL